MHPGNTRLLRWGFCSTGVLLACVLGACSTSTLVVNLDDDASSPARAAPAPAASDCASLPAADPRIPWAEGWQQIAYSHDGRSVALIGPPSYRLDRAQEEPTSGKLRDAGGSVDGPVRELEAGLQLVRWDAPTGPRIIRAPDDFSEVCGRHLGAWSPDDRYFACTLYRKLSIKEIMAHKGVSCVAFCDVGAGVWNTELHLEGVSNPAWSPDSAQVALVTSEVAAPADVVVCDLGGHVLRSTRLSDQDRGLEPFLTWSPDGRFLAILTWSTGVPTPELRVLDANTLAIIDRRLADGWTTGGVNQLPQWSPDSASLVTPVYRGIGLATIQPDGHIHGVTVLPRPNAVVQLAWCPDGRRLLTLENQYVKDLLDLLDALKMQDCTNGNRRYDGRACFVDPATGEATECPDTLQSQRVFAWRNAWLFPRVGEAFARWTR